MPKPSKVDWDRVDLTRPMKEIKAQYRVSGETVMAARRARGIEVKTYRGPRIDWSQVPLGRRADRHLARELGCSEQAVARARLERGIPPHKRPKKEASPAARPSWLDFRMPVLVSLAELGPSTASQVAERMGRLATSVTKCLTDLHEVGCVHRSGDRPAIWSVTDEGRARVADTPIARGLEGRDE